MRVQTLSHKGAEMMKVRAFAPFSSFAGPIPVFFPKPSARALATSRDARKA
jgi:hypothetical protein